MSDLTTVYAAPEFYIPCLRKMRFKKLPAALIDRTAKEVKALLHCCRDSMRNAKKDTTTIRLDTLNPYYSEAFGVLRGLALLHYGFFGPVNIDGSSPVHRVKTTQPEQNLSWWFETLVEETLAEEHFKGDNQCDYCFARYGKDAVRR